MNLFNFCVLWVVKIALCFGSIILGVYIGSLSGGLVAEEAAENPLATLIITVVPVFMTWMITLSTLSLWKIGR